LPGATYAAKYLLTQTHSALTLSFDAKRLFHNQTGLGNYSRTLVRNLLKYGAEHELHLFTPSTSKHQESLDLSNQCRVHTPQGMAGVLGGAYWRSRGMVTDLRQLKPLLYHGLSHELPYGLSGHGIGQVVTMHDLIFKKYPQTFGWFDRQVFAAKWRHSLEASHTVVAISQHTAQDLMEHYHVPESKIKVVYQSCQEAYYAEPPSPLELAAFRAAHQLPEQIILSVGSVIERKNLLTGIKALHSIAPTQRPYLVVVGEGGAYKQLVINEVKRLGLTDSVRFWSAAQVDVQTLRMLYASACASVFVSVYEGFGLPVAESLLCGTPVLAAMGSSLQEAGGGGAIYVANPLDAEEVAHQLAHLLGDDELRSRLQSAGRQYVHETLAPEITTRAMLDVYAEFA
jgi:glycosyltransferase involved in cell wall biosynthesis